jgi:hypothetical protein
MLVVPSKFEGPPKAGRPRGRAQKSRRHYWQNLYLYKDLVRFFFQLIFKFPFFICFFFCLMSFHKQKVDLMKSLQSANIRCFEEVCLNNEKTQ